MFVSLSAKNKSYNINLAEVVFTSLDSDGKDVVVTIQFKNNIPLALRAEGKIWREFEQRLHEFQRPPA